MRHRTARRLTGSTLAALAAVMVLPGSAFAITFTVDPLGGSIVEGAELAGGRLARVAIDIPSAGPPSAATCRPFVDAHTATVDWDDGTSDALTKNNLANGGTGVCLFDVRAPAHRFARARPEPHNVRVTVAGGGASVTQSRTLLVTEAAVSGTLERIDGNAGVPTSEPLGTISDANTLSTADQFSATMNWGDGSSTPVTVTGAGGRYTVVGSHTYAAEGTYPLTLSVVHGGRSIVLASEEARIDAPDDAVAAPGAAVQQTAASLAATPSPSFRIVGTRFRRGSLRSQGVRLRIGLGAFAGSTIRLELRGASRPGGTVRTLGTQTIRIAGARVVDARNRVVEVRWRCAAKLLKVLRAGRSYGVRVRFTGSGTLQDRLALRR